METISPKTENTAIGLFDIAKVTAEQEAIARQGRLHWFHWAIFLATLLITLFAWSTSKSSLDKQKQSEFEQESERVISLMRERIEHYADALLSGVAAMQAQNGEMSREQWRIYTSHLQLTERYPGANGIGVIHYVDTQNSDEFIRSMQKESPGFSIHPEHNYDLSLPIAYIEPELPNKAAVGLDVAFETNRRSAALFARASGTTQLSGPISLVQDDGDTPGFLFYAPYYRHSDQQATAWTYREREKNFQGLIYAPVIVKNLVEGVLSEDKRSVKLSISDEDVVLYEETAEHYQANFSMTRSVPMYGRDWTYKVSSLPVSAHGGANQPTIVLVSGLAMDVMLFGLFCLMRKTNQRTLVMAKTMTDTLASQTLELTEKNRDLESFAHVVSHDLKAPLRNIGSLVGIIDEDYGQYLASNDEGMEINETLNMVTNQINRGQNLINGILEYSKVGSGPKQIEPVNTRNLVENVARQLDLTAGQLTLSGSFPTIATNATLLEQVFSNLIGNAIKFNPGIKLATVEVSVQMKRPNLYSFSVKDNGPGIEPQFHQRIFKQFASLNTDPNIISSGIGLSIVQRALEMQGGGITIDSAIGQGSTFEFTWPVSQLDLYSEEVARSA